MTLRILHAAQMRQPPIGVIRQMEYESHAAEELGIPWTSKLFCPSSANSAVVVRSQPNWSWWKFKQEFFDWLNTQTPHFDAILLRYSMYDPFQAKFIANCSLPIFSMHHTLEVSELRSYRNVRGYTLSAAEVLIGSFTLRRVTGVVSVTREIASYEKKRARKPSLPTLHYSNGAKYSNDPTVDRKPSDVFQFIDLSSAFPPWMGLDLLLDAAAKSQDKFIIHIVGKLTDRQFEAVSADSRFIAHGYLSQPEIENLMARCTLGLSTFAIERKNFTEGNTLKVREYLRAGLPVYAGYKDIFEDSFPYYRNGPADLHRILEYATEMQSVDRKTVSDVARPIIDKNIVLRKIYEEICSEIKR